MKQTDVDWRSGRVTYWEMDSLDASKPLADQQRLLDEDLAQIAFGSDVLIDVGWYPAFSMDGGFNVQVIEKLNWDRPVMTERCTTVAALMASLT